MDKLLHIASALMLGGVVYMMTQWIIQAATETAINMHKENDDA